MTVKTIISMEEINKTRKQLADELASASLELRTEESLRESSRLANLLVKLQWMRACALDLYSKHNRQLSAKEWGNVFRGEEITPRYYSTRHQPEAAHGR